MLIPQDKFDALPIGTMHSFRRYYFINSLSNLKQYNICLQKNINNDGKLGWLVVQLEVCKNKIFFKKPYAFLSNTNDKGLEAICHLLESNNNKEGLEAICRVLKGYPIDKL